MGALHTFFVLVGLIGAGALVYAVWRLCSKPPPLVAAPPRGGSPGLALASSTGLAPVEVTAAMPSQPSSWAVRLATRLRPSSWTRFP